VKISKTRLKEIIKEEIERVAEAEVKPIGTPQDLQKAAERILQPLTPDQRNTLQLYYIELSKKKGLN